MKKTEKSLTLSRETLRRLAQEDLREAAGGSCLTCLPDTCGCPGWETGPRKRRRGPSACEHSAGRPKRLG